MTFSVQSDFSFTPMVNHVPEPETGSGSGGGAVSSSPGQSSPAYVYDITPGAAEVFRTRPEDTPLSAAETDQLFSAYAILGKENALWENIGNILGEITGNDRTNFLAALSGSGNNLESFVLQVERLEETDRTLYLKAAVRIGEEGLSNLVEATDRLSGAQVTAFLETADQLGRSVESIKANELENFLSTIARSPQWTDKFIRTTLDLTQEDRALFLGAAPGAGEDLGRMMETVNRLSASDLSLFLEAGINAGDGMSNLIDITEETRGQTRASFLAFTAGLSGGETRDFLLATQGRQETLSGLMSTLGSLEGEDRSSFLSLAADTPGAGDAGGLDRLRAMVDSLGDDPALRSDFLATAVKAENRLDQVLTLGEELFDGERSRVFAFSSTLSLGDLANFISAAGSAPEQAYDLARTANDLEGTAKSHFLYAGAMNPDQMSRLTTLTRELQGDEQRDFLYAGANISQNTPGAADGFFNTASQLTGAERAAFLAGEKLISAGLSGKAGEYVHLRSVFEDDQFDLIMGAGEGIDELLAEVDALDASRRDAYLEVAAEAGPDSLPRLMSLAGKLDEERSSEFIDYARTLNGETLSNLIEAAQNALEGPSGGVALFDRLMETARGLDPVLDQDFLNAAAASGSHLESFIEMTNRLEGFLKTDFLISADGMADHSEDLLGNFIKATDHVLEKSVRWFPKNDDGSGPSPAQIIQGSLFQGDFGMIEDFLRSTAWIGGKISGSHMNDWLNSWQGIPLQADA